jgi:hypothetical protein
MHRSCRGTTRGGLGWGTKSAHTHRCCRSIGNLHLRDGRAVRPNVRRGAGRVASECSVPKGVVNNLFAEGDQTFCHAVFMQQSRRLSRKSADPSGRCVETEGFRGESPRGGAPPPGGGGGGGGGDAPPWGRRHWRSLRISPGPALQQCPARHSPSIRRCGNMCCRSRDDSHRRE